MEKITFEEIHKEMMVQTSDGIEGRVISCDDIHNIEIAYKEILVNGKYEWGGGGFFCLDNTCLSYESLFKVND